MTIGAGMGQGFRYIALFALLALAMTGCSRTIKFILYNNGSSLVRVVVGDDLLAVRSGRARTFAYQASNGGTFEVDDVHLCIDEQLFRYTLPLPFDYVHDRFEPLRIQIDEQGTIWVLQPEQQFPLLELDPQPEPFPLTGTAAGECQSR